MKRWHVCALVCVLLASCSTPRSAADREETARKGEVEGKTAYAPPTSELVARLAGVEGAPDDVSRLEAVQCLTEELPHPAMVRPLMSLLDGKVEVEMIAVQAYACGVFEGVALMFPEAFEDDDVRALVTASARSNTIGQHLYSECSPVVRAVAARSLAQMGARDATKSLLTAALEGSDPDMDRMASLFEKRGKSMSLEDQYARARRS